MNALTMSRNINISLKSKNNQGAIEKEKEEDLAKAKREEEEQRLREELAMRTAQIGSPEQHKDETREEDIEMGLIKTKPKDEEVAGGKTDRGNNVLKLVKNKTDIEFDSK